VYRAVWCGCVKAQWSEFGQNETRSFSNVPLLSESDISDTVLKQPECWDLDMGSSLASFRFGSSLIAKFLVPALFLTLRGFSPSLSVPEELCRSLAPFQVPMLL
jgi:hypothetical protein